MRSQALGLSTMLKQNTKYKDFGFCPSCNHNEPIGKYFFSKIYKTTVFPLWRLWVPHGKMILSELKNLRHASCCISWLATVPRFFFVAKIHSNSDLQLLPTNIGDHTTETDDHTNTNGRLMDIHLLSTKILQSPLCHGGGVGREIRLCGRISLGSKRFGINSSWTYGWIVNDKEYRIKSD